MKIRLGFVSNSSSSSYTCDVCNYTTSGMDLGYSEADMMSCVNGHEFCTGHAIDWEMTWEDKKAYFLSIWSITKDGYKKHLVESIDSEEKCDLIVNKLDLNVDYDCYEVPPQVCPLCTFGEVYERDALAYMLKVAGRTEKELLSELRERFESYGEMKKWLKDTKS